MSSEIFRDRSEGVNARRLELLRRRRDEFVLMPHAIRRVYVARRARSAASIAVWLTGIAMLVCAMSPKLAAYVTRGMPGINPALLSTLVIAMWVIAIVAYFVARARCEHHFSVAMSKTVLPSENADADVERLSHEHPDEVARRMAHRLEVRASAWPVAAIALIVPATLLYVFYGFKHGGWPAIAEYEASLATNAGKLAFIAGAGAVMGLATTHRAFRRSSALVWLLSLGTVSLRKERAMLETDDPAAGSELFTWRAFATSVVATLESIGSKLNKRQGRIALVAGVATVASLGFVTGRRTHAPAPAPKAAVAQVVPQQLIVNKETGSSYKVTADASGVFEVQVTLTDDKPLTVRLPGLSNVPAGWRARVTLTTISAPAIEATMFGDTRVLDSAVELSASACSVELPALEAIVRGAPGSYTLIVRPVLEPAGC